MPADEGTDFELAAGSSRPAKGLSLACCGLDVFSRTPAQGAGAVGVNSGQVDDGS